MQKLIEVGNLDKLLQTIEFMSVLIQKQLTSTPESMDTALRGIPNQTVPRIAL